MKKIKKICVITGSRAEYGLLSNLIKSLKKNNNFNLKVIVTGTHLSKDHGFTYKEILSDKILISGKVDLKIGSTTHEDISEQMGNGLKGFSKLFMKSKPDLIIILGDRYEILICATVATLFNIPIAHIHGGEITEGAMDNAFRHAITKMSHIHFAATKRSKLRILQLGENKKLVLHVGSLGVENIKNINFLNKQELEKILKIDLSKQTFLITFHPETISQLSFENQINPLLNALKKIENINFLFTMSNSDLGGDIINKKIKEFVRINKNSYFYKNLGHLIYLSVLKYCTVVIGNSSSGIIEAPSFKIPSINIGDRQLGREKHYTVFDCANNERMILRLCRKLLKNKYISKSKIFPPYEKKNTTKNIVNFLEKVDIDKINLKKFRDIVF